LVATEIEDRLNIADLLSKYAEALDTRDWELLASCFEPTAWADYGGLGGRQEGAAAIVAYCRAALGPLDASQHLIANVRIDFRAEAVRSRCDFQAQHVLHRSAGGSNLCIGGTYLDLLSRSGGGWKIAEREFKPTWYAGNPGVFEDAGVAEGATSALEQATRRQSGATPR
jgi:3-phenylpropionate/cinnamic acid dioxygenase small subunit